MQIKNRLVRGNRIYRISHEFNNLLEIYLKNNYFFKNLMMYTTIHLI